MTPSLILRTAARLLVPLILLFSIFLMLRGHNESGGGFIGGLVASGSFALYAMAYGVAASKRALRADPRTLMAAGLGTALVSGLIPVVMNGPLLKGLWVKLPGGIKIGTPILFDVGVYLLVIGVTLIIIYELEMFEERLFSRRDSSVSSA